MTKASLTTYIEQASNQCVKCGLCSTVCPTYQLTHDEAESARGRIALMQGLVQGNLPLTPRLQQHLDNCLSCGLCETVCPAKVDYSYLIDSTRLWLEQNNKPRPTKAISLVLRWLVKKPWRMRALHRVLYSLQQLGILKLIKKLSTPFQRAQSYLPTLPPIEHWQTDYPSLITPYKGQVGLFQGCMQPLFDQTTLLDSIRLLNQLGFDVHMPKGQHCCGALALHMGKPEDTTQNALNNNQLFNQIPLNAVITTTPGCSAVMKNYQQHPLIQTKTSLQAPLMDIHPFLAKADWSHIQFRPCPLTIALHTPCTQNSQFSAAIIEQLLQRIPEITIIPLHTKPTCCGAAGSYMLDNPEMADGLCEKLLSDLPIKPDIIVSSNLGCLLHLHSFLQRHAMNTKVQHPISLLAQYVIYNTRSE